MSTVAISLEHKQSTEIYPAQLTDLYAGKPLYMSFRLPPGRHSRGRLLDSVHEGANATGVRREVIETALDSHLVTPFTSLVILHAGRSLAALVRSCPDVLPVRRSAAWHAAIRRDLFSSSGSWIDATIDRVQASRIVGPAKRIFLAAAATAFALMLGEGLCHLLCPSRYVFDAPEPLEIDPYSENPFIVSSKPFLYFHIPGASYRQKHPSYNVAYHINARGFRGPNVDRARPRESKRLLFIGDSIVEGHGCEFEQTFAWLLAQELRPTGWDVLNVGVQGASPIYYAANLDRYLALEPDAVVLTLFDNDLYEDRVREASYPQLPVWIETTSLTEPSAQRWWRRSRLAATVAQVFRARALGTRTNDLEQLMAQNRGARRTNEDQRKLDSLSPYLVAPSLMDREWELSANYLDYLVDRLNERGVQVLVMSLSLGSVSPDNRDEFQQHSMMMDGRARQWAGARGLPFLSLVDAVHRQLGNDATKSILIPQDGHPSPDGHRWIVKRIAPWVREGLQGNAGAPG